MIEPKDTDSELFAAWATGDRVAGNALIVRHQRAIERFFSHKAGDRGDDLVQQTFLNCLAAANSFRGDGSFRAFMYGVAHNVLLGHIRGRVKTGREVPDFATSTIADLVPGAATLIGQQTEQRLLVLALQRIPVDLQMLLELFYWEDLSVDELAQTFDVPPGTIKSRLHRARRMLKDALDAAPGDEVDKRGARTLLGHWLADMRARAPDGEG